jgi:hypothetical protein
VAEINGNVSFGVTVSVVGVKMSTFAGKEHLRIILLLLLLLLLLVVVVVVVVVVVLLFYQANILEFFKFAACILSVTVISVFFNTESAE